MVKHTLAIIINCVLASFFCGQIYGQKFSFMAPIKLSEEINSEAEELNPLLSPDGKSLYFSRIFYEKNQGGAYAGGDIYVSHKASPGAWGAPVPATEAWNTRGNDELIGFNDEDKTYYLRDPKRPDKGILFSRKTKDGFTSPERIPIKGLSKEGFMGFYMHSSYKMLLISMKGDESKGEEDLYISLKDEYGNWGDPIHLGETVNSPGYEISPYLSDDGLKLYFASNGHGGYGDADIFVSERKYGVWDVWSKPINLGNQINSEKFDAYFSINLDSTCYFVSNRDGQRSDIYASKLIPGATYKTNAEILSLLKETQDLLSEIKASDTNSKYNYITFEEGSAVLTDGDKVILDIWVESLKKNSVTKTIKLTFDNAFNVTYDDELLFSKRMNTIFSYLTGKGVDENQLEIVRRGESLGLSADKSQTTVVLTIE